MFVPGPRIGVGQTASDMIFRAWPDLSGASVDWIEDGWDFLVARVGEQWAVRLARRPTARFRLARERALLSVLGDAPCPIPQYQRLVPGMALYPWIPGQGVAETLSSSFLRDVAAFLTWLHTQPGLGTPKNARQHWIRRTRAFCRRAAAATFPLLVPKEAKLAVRRFEEGLARLESGHWSAVLLHGDLSREHALAHQDRLSGVIDFGDWQWGDYAFDWCGIPGLAEAAAPNFADDPEFLQRVNFYRFLVPFHGIQFGLKTGHVQTVELGVRLVRRSVLTQGGH